MNNFFAEAYRNISDVIRDNTGNKPKTVNGLANVVGRYYINLITEIIFGRFDITGCPEWWDMDYIKEGVFLDGKLCVTDVGGYGITPLKCSLTGINIFEHYTTALIANSVIGNLERMIDVDCRIVHINRKYTGLWGFIRTYAYRLAACDASVDTNLMNTRVAFLFPVESAKEAKEVKNIYDKVTMGEPSVVYNKGINVEPYTFPVKANYIAGDVMDLKNRIMQELLTRLGINSANTVKKERMIKDEVNSNNMECMINVNSMIDTIKRDLDGVNKMYGLNLRLELKEVNVQFEGDNTAGNGELASRDVEGD